MIIINKKTIKIVLTCIFIFVFTFSFQIANNQKNIIDNKKETTIETTATPVSGKTIVVDAGHGIPDEGAQSSTRYNRSTN